MMKTRETTIPPQMQRTAVGCELPRKRYKLRNWLLRQNVSKGNID